MLTTKTHNDVDYNLFPTSIDSKDGKKQVGIAAIPVFSSLEDIASLITDGWLTEESVVTLLRGQWAVRQRAVVKSAATGKRTYTPDEMMRVFGTIDNDIMLAKKADGTLAEYMKQVWKDEQTTEVDANKVFYAVKNSMV